MRTFNPLNSFLARWHTCWMALFLAVAPFAVDLCHAQPVNEWTALGSGNWDAAGNWSLNQVPDSMTARVLFGPAVNGDASVNLQMPRTVQGIEFNNSAESYSITGSPTLTLAGAPQIQLTAGIHYLSVNLAGTSGFTKLGSGTLDMGGFHELSGPISVAQGTLQVLDERLPGDVITIQSGAIVVGGLGDTFDPRQLDIRQGQVITGSGVLDVGLLDVLSNPNASLQRAELRGNITVDTRSDSFGRVENRGLVSPGLLTSPSSIGVMTIDGDYWTTSYDAVLEIEVGGTANGQADKLVVAGEAEIDGELHLSFANGYIPSANHTITVVDAQGITSFNDSPLLFDSILVPDLSTGGQNLTIDMLTLNGGADLAVRFIPFSPESVFFDEQVQTDMEWFDDIWSGPTPSLSGVVVIENQINQDQRVNLYFEPVFIHRLDVRGSGMHTMALGVDGSSLSVIDGVTIGNGGVLDMEFGKVVSRQITVESGGWLMGNGRLSGQVTIESGGQLTAGDPEESVDDQLEIDGDMHLESGSLLTLELGDNIAASGEIQLGGTLVLNATDIQFGNSEMFLTANNIVGEFDSIEIIQPENAYVALSFSVSAIGGTPFPVGDYNQNNEVDMEDLDRFILGLLNAEAYLAAYSALPTAPGDMNNDGYLDFDDVSLFADALNGASLETVLAAIADAQHEAVPEPASHLVALLPLIGVGAGRKFSKR
jgi:autotransporter-associated beta strand protein